MPKTLILLIDFFVSMTLIYFADMFSGYFSGFYCPEGSAYPQVCEAGSYCNQTGLEAPAGHCAAGYYCPTGSLDPYATLCPSGHYCPLVSPLPLPCPLGTMKSETYLVCYRHVIIRSVSRVVFSSLNSRDDVGQRDALLPFSDGIGK